MSCRCLQIDQLLGLYEKTTGQKFGGGSGEYDTLARLAASNNVPFKKEILQKL